jgi:hypothetical protein
MHVAWLGQAPTVVVGGRGMLLHDATGRPLVLAAEPADHALTTVELDRLRAFGGKLASTICDHHRLGRAGSGPHHPPHALSDERSVLVVQLSASISHEYAHHSVTDLSEDVVEVVGCKGPLRVACIYLT